MEAIYIWSSYAQELDPLPPQVGLGGAPKARNWTCGVLTKNDSFGPLGLNFFLFFAMSTNAKKML